MDRHVDKLTAYVYTYSVSHRDATEEISMKAITRQKYGSTKVLQFTDIPEPSPGPGQVKIAVAAASVNPYDWHILYGEPYLIRFMSGLKSPKLKGIGADVAGTVVELGEGVEGLTIGDEVFGWGSETFAESALAKAGSVALKPASMSFEAAACIPCAGITALQSLRDKTKRQPGQRILINGASGGVGTFAVQIAKSYGAIVTGVCGPTSGELVRSLGADFTIDYTEEDFAKTSQPFDIVLDVAGNRTLKALRTAAGDHGVVVLSAGDKGKWIAPMKLAAGAVLEDRFVSQELHNVLANVNRADLEVLASMFEAGTLKPVIERTYPLVDAASAIETVEAGHVHGKLVVTVKTP